MFSVFVDIVENALKKSISKRKVYIRNDKNNLTIHQNWIKADTKRNTKYRTHEPSWLQLPKVTTKSLGKSQLW